MDRILVVRAGALGDTLMATPLIRALRGRYPAAEIDFLASAPGAELLALNGNLSQRLVLRQRNWPYWLSAEKWKLVREIRSRGYDFAVLLEAAARYRELLERAGVREIRDFRSTPFDPGLHSIVNNLRVAGFSNYAGMDLDMELPASPDSLLVGLARPVVTIHPGYGPANKKKDQERRLRGWSSDKFAEVAREIVAHGGSVVLTGSQDDLAVCESIVRGLPEGRARVIAGETTVGAFVAAIKASDALVSVDSAAAHIAAAVGTPVVVLWGPAIFEQTSPMSSSTPITVIRKGVPCAPCYGTPLMRACERNICMQEIGTGEVVGAVLAALMLSPGLVQIDTSSNGIRLS